MSKVLPRSWLESRDLLGAWIGCYLGGWGGLTLAHMIERAIAWARPTVEGDAFQEMSEELLLMPLRGLAFLVGAAAGVALLLRLSRMYRPVATGVATSLSTVITIPVLFVVVGGLFGPDIWTFLGIRLVTAVAALLSAEIGLLVARGRRRPNRNPNEPSSSPAA